MTFLRIIDTPVLWIVERGAHFIQRTFGIPPMVLARVFYAVWLVAVSIEMISEKTWIQLSIWMPIGMLYYVFGLQGEQNRSERDAMNGLRNRNRESGYETALRVLWLFASVFLVRRKTFVPAFSLALFHYLRACDTLPPGISRVRNLWNALTRVSVQREVQEGA